MKSVSLFVCGLSALTALSGLMLVWVMFVPVPTSDLLDMTGQIIANGAWRGYGVGPLLTHHNEHRLVLTRLAVLVDLAAFQGRQDLLITLILGSALVTAVLLSVLARGMKFTGWPLAALASLAFAVAFSPVQHENLLSGFQVQFIQVWTFAILAFGVLALAPPVGSGSHWSHRVFAVAIAIQAGLLSTYSMKNGLIVWPLLVILGLWLRLGWWTALGLIAVGAFAIWGEVVGFHLHPGHADPMDSLNQPVQLALYSFRYLTSGVRIIGTLGQEILGGAAVLFIVGLALFSLIRRGRFTPAEGVILATAGFVMASAFVTALGRIDFGLSQANASRYTTPSLIFLWCAAALALRCVTPTAPGDGKEWGRMPVIAVAVAGVLLLVPGLVSNALEWRNRLLERDERRQIAAVFMAAGPTPETMNAAYPFSRQVPYRAFDRLKKAGKGPFADTERIVPFVPEIGELWSVPDRRCIGSIDEAHVDPRTGLVVKGWMAWAQEGQSEKAPILPESSQPELALVTDDGGRLIGWGISAGRAERPLQAKIRNRNARRYIAAGPLTEGVPDVVRVIGISGDRSRTCLLGQAEPTLGRFMVPRTDAGAPVDGGPWRTEGATGETVSDDVYQVESSAKHSIDVAWGSMTLRPDAALAIPIRTWGAYPEGLTVSIFGSDSTHPISAVPVEMAQDDDWYWLVFKEASEFPSQIGPLSIRVRMDRQPFSVGVALGVPLWLDPVEIDGGE